MRKFEQNGNWYTYVIDEIFVYLQDHLMGAQ